MTLRTLTSKDLQDMVRLENLCFPEDAWSPEVFQSDIQDEKSRYYGLVKDGHLVGMLALHCLRPMLNHTRITSLCIHPDFRRRGYAKQLVMHMLEEMKDLSRYQITGETRQTNQAMRDLFRYFGFKEIALRRNYYRNPLEDAVVYELNLGEEA